MRLVQFKDLAEGMIVGQTIYGVNGEKLAEEGKIIKDTNIKRLKLYNIPYMYIIDKYSQDIEIECTISTSVKNDAVQNIKRLYSVLLKDQKNYHELMQDCLASIDKIVDSILSTKVNLYDIFDIKMLDIYRYQHPVAVTIISVIIGKSIGLNALELYRLAVGAFFHDIGQLFVPKEILNKRGIYTENDYKIMKTHPESGYRFAKDMLYLPTKSYLAILQHHERYDGTGYPSGRCGESISIYGRIVAIADVFDALSSEKSYRPALNPLQTFKTIVENTGKIFDPEFTRVFANKVSPYPIGYTLNISNERVAIVIKNYEGRPFNPTVKVIQEKSVLLDNPYIIDL
jgi:HD-GYP domain-containing protein (c-di-GMP phosphodiesterase class II)